MELKTYQSQTLDTLRRFLEQARVEGPSAAYEAIVAEPAMAKRLKGFAGSYRPLNALDETPYVCLRLPTGGGKTLLAAHAVNIAKEAWIERDFPLVLWLVPTTTIRKQTVDALKNPRHPYRAALDDAFASRVRVSRGVFVLGAPRIGRTAPVPIRRPAISTAWRSWSWVRCLRNSGNLARSLFSSRLMWLNANV